MPLQRRLLVRVEKLYFGKVVADFDDVIVIVIKGNASCMGRVGRVISCGLRDCAVFVFTFELEVLVEIPFIVVHDLEEFFKLFSQDIIILSRYLKF
jgi:hypothetical protein